MTSAAEALLELERISHLPDRTDHARLQLLIAVLELADVALSLRQKS